MLKTTIRRMFSPTLIKQVKKYKALLKAVGTKKIVTSNKYDIYSLHNKHVFFGYYDLPQFSEDEKKILVHAVPVNAVAGRDNADIGYFDTEDKSFHKICETAAWSWQQGARLRWNPINPEQVIYNDVQDGNYVCRVCDVNKKEIVCTYECAFYDIDSNFSYGLTLDFSLLQRLRPGYGYSNLQEEKDETGIEQYDFKNRQKKMLVKLSDLANDIPNGKKYEHYINHISIAPSGRYFIFFHLMSPIVGGHWINRLIVYDLENEKYRVLEDKCIVSHYCWKDDDSILVTCCDRDGTEHYRMYDIHSGAQRPFCEEYLKRDGHPTFIRDKIISDTYPDGNSNQTLFLTSDHGPITELAKVFHYPFMTGEKRCDLHPRVSKSKDYVCIDTMAMGRKRSCCIIKINGIEFEQV